MANFTRMAIKESFYHYQDLPSLIEEIVKEEAESIIRSYPSITTIVECFDAVTEFASREKKAIMHIYRSINRDDFERNLMMVCEYFVHSYVDMALRDESISTEDKKTIIDYYKCVCFGLTIDWLNNGMTEVYTSSIRRIFLLKKRPCHGDSGSAAKPDIVG